MDEYREAEADERLLMNDYLDKYDLFERVCKARGGGIESSEQRAILFHGYITGGK